MEGTSADQCFCQSVYGKPRCGVRPCLSMSRSSDMREGMEPGPELGREGNKRQKGTGSTDEKSVCFRSESVVWSPFTSNFVGIELDDEVKKVFGLKLGLCFSAVLRKTTPGGAAHLRNGLPHGGARRTRGWAPKGAAPLRNGRVAKRFAHLRLYGRVPNVGSLRKRINRLDMPAIHEDSNAANRLEDSIVPRPADVVAEEEAGGGEGIVVRATEDFGVDGNRIELPVLSPAEYEHLVFNVHPKLPLDNVDADYL